MHTLQKRVSLRISILGLFLVINNIKKFKEIGSSFGAICPTLSLFFSSLSGLVKFLSCFYDATVKHSANPEANQGQYLMRC